MKISLIGSVITHLFIKTLNVLSHWSISVVFVEASVRHKVFTFYRSHPFAPQVKETHYRIMFRICKRFYTEKKTIILRWACLAFVLLFLKPILVR